ncbi:FUSC family membrane protein [Flavihumibacter sp. CACIAM 22H1]|uniref:FUSC family protein n=1 Tax=Flavihumibacter sp. CACIAM 22H1 TaxID=1812911 RepID=UPI0007A89E9E|nr:FUSC family membrane protein [Flavihumibacter sp. CACIAM 22H1]KYP15713.1 MAG: hypothetical protein A1D16_19320 [Flavihumibacter sp. CACIAM 22H1]
MIEYIREYKKYSSSYYVSEGVRTTAGVMVPLLTASYFGHLDIGIALGLGALCVGITDNTGPIHHRVNGMVAALLLIFISTLVTGFCMPYPWLLAGLITVMGFVCSIIGVYGVRAAAVGAAGLLVMILSIDDRYDSWEVLRNALLVSAGGLFYLAISLLLYRLRPYKLIEQALGDSLLSMADYLRTRAGFYNEQVDYDKNYKEVLEQQVLVHNKQSLVREMLFKTRDIVRESTHKSRILMMIFLDSVDLFERIMTSQQDYRQLHQVMDKTGLLPVFKEQILLLSEELEKIGLALQEGRVSIPGEALEERLKKLEVSFVDVRNATMDDTNIEGFVSLRHILNSVKDIQSRILTIHRYTSFDKKIGDAFSRTVDYTKFVSPSDFNLKLLVNNLSIHSTIFRHSVRVAVSLLAGFFLSRIFPFGHGYWILLTILVILKPAYSLTKQRNIERLTGTFFGAIIGVILLWLIRDDRLLVAVMITGMVIAYSMVRIKYMVSVIAMTAYILIAFHFLKPGDFSEVLRDRLIDTFAGSVIAFIASFAVPPKWEHEQIQELLEEAILANARYFAAISRIFLNEPLSNEEYKLSRKEAFVKLANLSDAFQRMLNEPKRQQKKVQLVHQMVVSNHMLASHIATLSSYRKMAENYASDKFQPIVQASLGHLQLAAEMVRQTPSAAPVLNAEDNFVIRDELKQLLEQRLKELAEGVMDTTTRQRFSELKTIADQFEYINKISIELEKLAARQQQK